MFDLSLLSWVWRPMQFIAGRLCCPGPPATTGSYNETAAIAISLGFDPPDSLVSLRQVSRRQARALGDFRCGPYLFVHGRPCFSFAFHTHRDPHRGQPAAGGRRLIHEVKFDGYGTQLIIERRRIRAYSRGGLDWTGRYPSVIRAAAAMKLESAIFDERSSAGRDCASCCRRTTASSSPIISWRADRASSRRQRGWASKASSRSEKALLSVRAVTQLAEDQEL